jgi:Fe-S cluster biogenesis protein NfuA
MRKYLEKMEAPVKSPIMIYTEQTPNPESLKFVMNKKLYHGQADFKEASQAMQWSPMATALFELPYVKNVYISNNFVTIIKEFNYEWADIMLPLKDFIKNYVSEEKPVINDGFEAEMDRIHKEELKEKYSDDDAALVHKIKELIDKYVKPAVESDGGNIEFKTYKNGVVTVIMQGSCSGCPSSSVTLKSGIEGMLKRMVPEVTDVVAEMG